MLEFNDLKSRINRDKFEELLDNEFNFINKKLIYRFEKLILNNNNIYKIFIKSFDLKIQIREYSNNNLFKSFVVSFLRIANLKLSILFNKKINKKLKEGKAFAFVGGDGAGKSTNIETIHNFFKSQIAVTTIHVGRPRFTTTSYLLIFLSKFFKFFKFFDLRNSMIFLAIAISRKAELSRGFKLKEKGEIVLFDRVPIKGITSMDCPKMHLIKNTKLTLFKNFEMYIYNNIYIMTSELDKLFVLKLNPKTAIKRRPEDNQEELLIRSGQIWKKNFTNYKNSEVIDTEINNIEAVNKFILNSIWRIITKI